MTDRGRISGFTLIEMAIVVTIIGLLTAGVLVGQTMYRAAKLQESVVGLNQVASAMRTFRDTYQAYPGDMTNATGFWGTAGGTGLSSDPACSGVNSLTLTDVRRTCNGNGNGTFYSSTDTYTPLDAELFRAPQHLANAGLIPGTYSGISGPASTANTLRGVNMMPGALPNSVYVPQVLIFPGTSMAFAGALAGNIQYGAASSTWPLGNILSPKELFAIDAKIDDGLPARGDVVAASNNLTTCTNSGSFPAPAVYQSPDAYDLQYLKTNAIACYMFYRNIYAR